jgi:hypothetical protein
VMTPTKIGGSTNNTKFQSRNSNPVLFFTKLLS